MRSKYNLTHFAGCVALFVLGVAGFAHAERTYVDETKDASMDGFVSINVVRGAVRVETWDKAKVQVTGQLDEEVQAFVFEASGTDTRIAVRVPRSSNNWFGRTTSDLSIMIPVNSRLDIAGVSTDVTVRGLQGPVEIGVVSGDIVLDGGVDRIELQSVSGEIDMRNARGRIRAKSVSGDIDSHNNVGPSSYGTVSGSIVVKDGGMELEVESVSGDIEVENEKFASVTGHSVSGDVEIVGVIESGGVVEFDNVSGSIRLTLQGNVDSRFEIETGSGRIRNRLSSDEPQVGRYTRDESLEFILGQGSAEVILSTRSGDVTILAR